MKYYIGFSVILFFFIFSNCNKNEYINDDWIPPWLKERIAEEEFIIEVSQRPMHFLTAWKRYKYKREYYFEYDDKLSSVSFQIYDNAGKGINFDGEKYTTYNESKCCERFVWKSPGYEKYF